jgi:hypothetical protein
LPADSADFSLDFVPAITSSFYTCDEGGTTKVLRFKTASLDSTGGTKIIIEDEGSVAQSGGGSDSLFSKTEEVSLIVVEPDSIFESADDSCSVSPSIRSSDKSGGGADHKRKHPSDIIDLDKATKVRRILPKVQQSAAAASAPSSLATQPKQQLINISSSSKQVMIPVTVKTTCKMCGVTIVASSMGELKNHVCSSREKNVVCPEEGCQMRFLIKSSLRYHLKHYHQKGVGGGDQQPRRHDVRRDAKTEAIAEPRKFVCSFAGCPKGTNGTIVGNRGGQKIVGGGV